MNTASSHEDPRLRGPADRCKSGDRRGFVDGLLVAGAPRVYAAARRPEKLALWKDPRVPPLALDLIQEETIAAAALTASDITALVNLAGVIQPGSILFKDGLEGARMEMEVNYFGTVRMLRDFAPVLKANGGGVVLNVLSVLSHASLSRVTGYSASKAATLFLTRSLRAELAEYGTRVIGVLPGFAATRMTEGLDVPKVSPREIVMATLSAIESGEDEVYPDATARRWLEQAVQRQVQAMQPLVGSPG
jgi:NAD(P)-dependent dehydrogenase (short-subunit alcohol dehydrogenase family)